MRKINKKDVKQLGAIIKHARLKMRLTLDKISNGNCCVSYLSKIENGKIVPDFIITRKIFERLGLDLDNTLSMFEAINLEKTISNLFYGNKTEISKAYETAKEATFSPKISLLKSVYYLQNLMFDELHNELLEIETVENRLESLEKDVFYYLRIEVALILNRLETALMLSQNYIYLDNTSSKLKYLIDEQKFKLNYFNKDDKVVSKNYYDLIRTFKGWIPESRQLFNRLMMLEFKTSFSNELIDIKKDNDFEQILSNFGPDYWYFYLMSLNNLKLYDEVIDKIERLDFKSAKIFAVKAIAIYHSNNKTLLKSFEAKMKEYEFNKEELVHKNFIFYIIHKMNNKMERLYEELKSDLLDYSLLYYNKFYNRYYYDDYEKFLLSTSKYKEASTFFKKYIKR
ncbi:MAG: helix-turn-helix domain-containing protein [Bacilli bacterium]